MEWKMQNIFNANEEIEDLKNYPNFKMTRIPHQTSETIQDDFLNKNIVWTSNFDTDSVKQFSAVCLLTAKYMAEVLGKDKVLPLKRHDIPTLKIDIFKVFGLIETNWGGTRIEAWMHPGTLVSCGIPDNVIENNPQNSNSYLFNSTAHYSTVCCTVD